VRVGGARPLPLITFTITSKVAVYAPAEWADTLALLSLVKICTLWRAPTAREGGGEGAKKKQKERLFLINV
jgi:hypothetical protein